MDMDDFLWWRVGLIGSVMYVILESFGQDWTYRHVLKSYLQPTLKSNIRYLFTTFVKDQYFSDKVLKLVYSEEEWHNSNQKIIREGSRSSPAPVRNDCSLILGLLFEYKKEFLTERMDTIVLMSKASSPLIIFECKKDESCARSITVDIQQWQWSLWKSRTFLFLIISIIGALIVEGTISLSR